MLMLLFLFLKIGTFNPASRNEREESELLRSRVAGVGLPETRKLASFCSRVPVLIFRVTVMASARGAGVGRSALGVW